MQRGTAESVARILESTEASCSSRVLEGCADDLSLSHSNPWHMSSHYCDEEPPHAMQIASKYNEPQHSPFKPLVGQTFGMIYMYIYPVLHVILHRFGVTAQV